MAERYEKLGPTDLRFNGGTAIPIANARTGLWVALATDEAHADLILSALNNLATAKAGLEALQAMCLLASTPRVPRDLVLEIVDDALAAMGPEAGT